MNSTYDIVLIQPPLFQSPITQNRIEIEYWSEMEFHKGKLLGDLPVEASGGILSIASYLDSKGFKVKILDFHLMDYLKRKHTGIPITKQDIISEIEKYSCNLFGLSVFTIADAWANKITNVIRNQYSKCQIFWGGYYPTHNAKSILEKNRNIDFIVHNEGELTIEQYLNCKGQRYLELGLNGISYYQDGQHIINNPGGFIANLDILPLQNYSLYDPEYVDFIIPRVYSTRGCNNNCDYCTADNSLEKKIRKRSISNIITEIKNIKNIHNKNFFVMGDLEFLVDKNHAIALCEEIIRCDLNMHWWCQVYPPNLDWETAYLLQKAGCIQVALGIESSNKKALEEINKEMSSDDAIRACQLIKRAHMQVQAYIMIGLPSDTYQSILENIIYIGELVENNLIDVTHLSTMVPYPGSKIYNDHQAYGLDLITTDPNKYFMNCDYLGSHIPPYNTKYLSNKEIYSLWLYGLSHLTESFKKSANMSSELINLYDKLGLNESAISLYKSISRISQI